VTPAAAAKLNVTSLTLESTAGRPIAYDRIVGFKTAIMQLVPLVELHLVGHAAQHRSALKACSHERGLRSQH
jgi:hypothetical protein